MILKKCQKFNQGRVGITAFSFGLRLQMAPVTTQEGKCGWRC